MKMSVFCFILFCFVFFLLFSVYIHTSWNFTLVLLIFPFRHKYTPYRPNCIKIFIWLLLLCFVFFFHFAVELWSNQRDITVNWSRLKKKLWIIIVKYSFSPICNISLFKCYFIMFNYYCFFPYILMKTNSFIIVFLLSFHSLWHQIPLPIKKRKKETSNKDRNIAKIQQ